MLPGAPSTLNVKGNKLSLDGGILIFYYAGIMRESRFSKVEVFVGRHRDNKINIMRALHESIPRGLLPLLSIPGKAPNLVT